MQRPKTSYINTRNIFCSLILALSFFIVKAQNDLFCGTTTSKERVNYYNSLKPQLKSFETEYNIKTAKGNLDKTSDLNYIPIKAHIIRMSNGSSEFTVKDLNEAIENLNDIYKEAAMSFYLYGGINYINNDDLYHYKKGDEYKLLSNNYTNNAINIYFIDNLENVSGESICGYTEERLNIIAMKTSCAINTTSLAHEIGHVFSLVHTHGWSDNGSTTELVDGSNCDTDGDGICDTPADPGLSYDNVDDNCKYIASITDANGDFYSPDVENIMSYSPKSCRASFTSQQFSRIYAYYKLVKENFSTDYSDLNNTNILSEIKIYPNPVTGGKISFNLSTFENAVTYRISNLQGQILRQGETTTTEIDVNNLPKGSYLISLKDENNSVVKKFIK
ncbi:zinc-dependent metalloprotease [Neotamlana laminarinivorans]|uniref:Zinc-dependent metalloprotease n=1 Tax=Neotamlana laminarinivorans TaxID=2883124 RepID=A0A9X1L520_9FLAO|nr:zinc-dependent metalloprotease [Tamlana laminarinivorans]MCB4799947.1 zinc-dependent metalloprotease [Tamlana laminarinivorans]